MSEEEVESQESVAEGNPESREYSEIEQKAMEKGWDPNFEGDENKRPISAEEFLDRQKLYDDLRARGRENKQLKSKLEALEQSHKTIAKRTYERAREDLKKEIAQAHEEGDTQTAIQKTDEMNQLDKEYEQSEPKADNTEAAREAYNEWVKENPWYENDSDLKELADDLGQGILQRDPDLQNRPDEFLQQITEKIKKAAPEKFQKPKRTSSVEGETSTKGNNKKKYSIKSLPEEDQKVAKRIVHELGTMSEEDYMKQYLGES